MTTRRRCAFPLVALVAALALATAAGAEIVTKADSEARTITFDVQAQSVDVDWYAALLRAAAHGDEISRVTIRIVPEEDVPLLCGAAAAACYSQGRKGGRIVVPAGKDLRVASTFLHEYGHHLDRTWSVGGVPELNGTPIWWQLRGMAAFVEQGAVAFDYARGWNRSVGEIFAEDYAWIHIPYQHAIPWFAPPDDALRTALFAELGGQPTAQLPETPAAGPLVINRSGTLVARRSQVVPFCSARAAASPSPQRSTARPAPEPARGWTSRATALASPARPSRAAAPRGRSTCRTSAQPTAAPGSSARRACA